MQLILIIVLHVLKNRIQQYPPLCCYTPFWATFLDLVGAFISQLVQDDPDQTPVIDTYKVCMVQGKPDQN